MLVLARDALRPGIDLRELLRKDEAIEIGPAAFRIGHDLTPDLVEAEIEGIGTLRNHVVSWQDAHGEPAPEKVDW